MLLVIPVTVHEPGVIVETILFDSDEIALSRVWCGTVSGRAQPD